MPPFPHADSRHPIHHHKLSFHETLLSGGVAGAMAKSLIAPFERQKILYQVSTLQFSFSAAFRAIYDTSRTLGVRELYKGNSASLLRIVPYAAIKYTSHDEYMKIAKDSFGVQLSAIVKFVCGALAGATSVLFTYPLELLRARLALNNYKNATMFSIVSSIIKNEGSLALFQGLAPTMIGQIVYSGLCFSIFETIKENILLLKKETSPDLDPYERFVGGALAGLMAQTISYPLDVVRRRMQVDPANAQRYHSILHAFSQIYKQEGFRALYKGVSMNWFKGPIAVGTSFTVFGYLKGQLETLHNDKE